MRGPRQCLRVDVLSDVRQLAVPDGNGEDETVLESLVRGFDFPLSPHFSSWVGAPGLRIGESSFARRAFDETEDLPDAVRV